MAGYRATTDAPPELYAQPRHVESLDDCWFYHTTDVPGHGTVPGNWDLRGRVETTHAQTSDTDSRVRLFTVVARRTAPLPKRPDGPFPWS